MFEPDLETLERSRLRTLQSQRLRVLLRETVRRIPFYRKLYESSGVDPGKVQSVEDLPRLPFVRKEHLRENYPFGLFGVASDEVRRIHASSGTTGKPTVVGYSAVDLEVFGDVNARSLAAAGARPGMMLHNAYGYGLFTGGLGLHMGAERLGLNVVPVSGGMTQRQIMLIQDFRPPVIACTPSYAQTLVAEFQNRNIPAEQISLRFALLGAEPWGEAIRAEVESGLGVEATNIYGLSEIIGPGVSQECVECKQGSHIWEDHFYPEIVDPESGTSLPPGERGVLVLTTLTRRCSPMIRYWTGDLTALDPAPCGCGRTHVRMAPIQGRTDDLLIIRGVNLYPSQVEFVLHAIPELSPHYQLIVEKAGPTDEIRLLVEVERQLWEETTGPDRENRFEPLRSKTQKLCREHLGLRFAVTLVGPGEIPASDGGKLNRVLDRRPKT